MVPGNQGNCYGGAKSNMSKNNLPSVVRDNW
jgi:hypothetical protein